MPKFTNENKDDLEKKLKYIELDLNNIPDFLKEFEEVDFKPSKSFDEKTYRVYKYLPVKDIQILLTPTDRLASVKEKYSLATPIYQYLEPKNEENLEKHAIFLHMLNKVLIEDIENVEELQIELNKKAPFGVKYYENYIWQIYYSKYTDKYFMMLPIKESEYSGLFYLLKKQLQKSKKQEYIYVPISYMDYSEEFLKKTEITDIENYLWLFTKNWPSIYEVYDKNGTSSLQITGQTYVYQKIESNYKLEFTSKEEATKFYKLVKALFILQTEIPHIYNFEIKLDSFGKIHFYFNNKQVTYDSLPDFINKEHSRIEKEIGNEDKNALKLKKELDKLKLLSIEKDMEYIEKEKQIATYLQCKKTFFGRVKYYIKYKNTNKKKKEKPIVEEEQQEAKKEEKLEFEEKQNYTIEDLVVISEKYNSKLTDNKAINLSIKSIQFKIKNMEKKIENATLYINEIDQHKKSIFEFWKFATKDEVLKLNENQTTDEEEANKLHKVFNYETDLEDLGEQADKLQRANLTKNETDTLFVLTTNILNSINILKTNTDISEKQIESINENLSQLLEEAYYDKSLFKIEQFDIFGNISEDKTKIKMLGNKKHRETAKDKFKILDITKDTKVEDYISILKDMLNNINELYGKVKSIYDMNIYCAVPHNKKIDENEFKVFNINPKNAIEEYNEDKLNLYCLKIKEGTPIIYFSNIIYYDNYNKTLPQGMDLSDKVLLDLSKFNFRDLNKNDFKVIEYINEKELVDVKTKSINVFEYVIDEKGNSND